MTYRRRLLEQYRAGLLPAGSEWAGKRLGVFVDGGRTKIHTVTRRQKGKGTTKTQRRCYRTDWRKPKLLIIVELDEHGRRTFGLPHETSVGRVQVPEETHRHRRVLRHP